MQTVEIIASLVGLTAGLLSGILWTAVSSRLGGHKFWAQFAVTAQALFSNTEASQFLKNYLKLLPMFVIYMGQIVLTVLLATLPVIVGYELLSPWADRVWHDHATQLEIQSMQPITFTSQGQSFELNQNQSSIPIDKLDLNQPAELVTEGGSFHCPTLVGKQAYTPSPWRWLLLTSLFFEDLHPAGEMTTAPLPAVLVRSSSGDNNFCWPYLNDWEFDFLALVCVGSVLSLFVPKQSQAAKPAGLKIQPSDYLLARFADSASPFLRWLGGIESKLTRHKLDQVRIEKPVFIAGLARSGTTILLELLSTIDGAATHRYRDFPFVMTPLLWNAFLKLVSRPQAPVERAHRDRIQITPESPEAFEEPIWKAFFPNCHAPQGRHVLTATDKNNAFDEFFQEHVQKILLLRKGSRYLSKENYNVTRVEYLARLFPDARFVVPIRHPFTHVHSLVRQHQLFSKYAADDPQVPDYLRAVGHYEFGPQRLPIQITPGTAERIRAAWSAGNDELGYAIQWAEIYGYVDRLRSDRPDLAERVLIVRYEDFCNNPREIMNHILEHIQVEPAQAQRVYAQLAGISLSAHVPSFSETVTRAVTEQVKDVATRFGYVMME